MKAILALFLVAALFAVAYSQLVYTSGGIPLANTWGSQIITSNPWGGVPVYTSGFGGWLKK